MEVKKEHLGFNSVALARAFAIQRFEANEPGLVITEWLQAAYQLTTEETKILGDLHAKVQVEGDCTGYQFVLHRFARPTLLPQSQTRPASS